MSYFFYPVNKFCRPQPLQKKPKKKGLGSCRSQYLARRPKLIRPTSSLSVSSLALWQTPTTPQPFFLFLKKKKIPLFFFFLIKIKWFVLVLKRKKESKKKKKKKNFPPDKFRPAENNIHPYLFIFFVKNKTAGSLNTPRKRERERERQKTSIHVP